jgi:hypothetical protein
MQWMVCSFEGSESAPLTLFPGDLVIHLRPDLWGAKPAIPDFWEMADHGELLITSRVGEIPPGVSPRAPSINDPVGDPPNVWRVRAGDRVVLIGERPQGRIHCLFVFRECALAHWRYGEADLPLPMEAMRDTAPSGSAAKVEWARLAVAKVMAMGVPNEFSTDWRLTR